MTRIVAYRCWVYEPKAYHPWAVEITHQRANGDLHRERFLYDTFDELRGVLANLMREIEDMEE